MTRSGIEMGENVSDTTSFYAPRWTSLVLIVSLTTLLLKTRLRPRRCRCWRACVRESPAIELAETTGRAMRIKPTYKVSLISRLAVMASSRVGPMRVATVVRCDISR